MIAHKRQCSACWPPIPCRKPSARNSPASHKRLIRCGCYNNLNSCKKRSSDMRCHQEKKPSKRNPRLSNPLRFGSVLKRAFRGLVCQEPHQPCSNASAKDVPKEVDGPMTGGRAKTRLKEPGRTSPPGCVSNLISPLPTFFGNCSTSILHGFRRRKLAPYADESVNTGRSCWSPLMTNVWKKW